MKQYPTDPTGSTDAGLPERQPPCTKLTWCTLLEQHDGACEVKPRRPIAPGDYGPEAAKRRRW